MSNWVVVYGIVGLVSFVVLWPTERRSRKLLQHWRVEEPTPEQIADVWTYLRRRRFWYPWIYLLLPFSFTTFAVAMESVGQRIVLSVLAAFLAAELLALRPASNRVRSAALVPRGVFDLVPMWGVAVLAVLSVLAAVFAMTDGRAPAVDLSATVLCLLAVGAVVWLAVIRRTAGDPVVDAVLRTRSARAALGLGIGLQSPLLIEGLVMPDWLSLAVVVGCVLVWIWVANPPVTLPLVAAT